MKVVHVTEAAATGTLRVVESLCHGHIREGLDAAVIHGRRPETPEQGIADRFPKETEIIEVEGWGSRSAFTELKSARAVNKSLSDLSPDIAVFHSSFAGMAGAIGRHSFPTVFVPHAFASGSRSRSARKAAIALAETVICGRFDWVVAVSESEARLASKRRPKNVKTIVNGIPSLDEPEWTRPPVRSSRRVVSAGRLVPQKLPLAAAEILGEIGDRSRTEVTWIGGGGSEPFASQARSVLEANGVDVTGWLDPENASRLLAESDVYLHWTSWDGLPLTVLEAFASDTAVVGSDVEPNREVLGESAVSADVGAAIETILQLLDDDSFWTDYVERQRLRARAFGETGMQTNWNSFLREIAGN